MRWSRGEVPASVYAQRDAEAWRVYAGRREWVEEIERAIANGERGRGYTDVGYTDEGTRLALARAVFERDEACDKFRAARARYWADAGLVGEAVMPC